MRDHENIEQVEINMLITIKVEKTITNKQTINQSINMNMKYTPSYQYMCVYN